MHLSDAEWKIMKALWRRSPAGARDVYEAVHAETRWAYTTVKTMLDRLVDKGAVRVRKERNAGIYEALADERTVRRSAVRSLLERCFEGASAPLVHFLLEEEKLSARERQQLTEILRKGERERGAS
jgi:BlaI family transcriptional regulator, penicillinase repressor